MVKVVLIDVLDCFTIYFFQHGKPVFGPSCSEFVDPECWHFDNDETSMIDDRTKGFGARA